MRPHHRVQQPDAPREPGRGEVRDRVEDAGGEEQPARDRPRTYRIGERTSTRSAPNSEAAADAVEPNSSASRVITRCSANPAAGDRGSGRQPATDSTAARARDTARCTAASPPPQTAKSVGAPLARPWRRASESSGASRPARRRHVRRRGRRCNRQAPTSADRRKPGHARIAWSADAAPRSRPIPFNIPTKGAERWRKVGQAASARYPPAPRASRPEHPPSSPRVATKTDDDGRE